MIASAMKSASAANRGERPTNNGDRRGIWGAVRMTASATVAVSETQRIQSSTRAAQTVA